MENERNICYGTNKKALLLVPTLIVIVISSAFLDGAWRAVYIVGLFMVSSAVGEEGLKRVFNTKLGKLGYIQVLSFFWIFQFIAFTFIFFLFSVL